MLYERGRVELLNPVLDSARVTSGDAVTPGTGVTLERLGRQVQMARLRLTNFVVNVAAASDFGSTKLLDLPAGNVIVVGGIADLTALVAGFTTNTVEAVDLALGTVAMASIDFSGAGEDDVTPKIDGVGAGTTGTIKGATGNTEKLLFKAAGANAVFINVADPVAAGTGVLTLNGLIDIAYIDLGKPS
jgi:hypothetical protein